MEYKSFVLGYYYLILLSFTGIISCSELNENTTSSWSVKLFEEETKVFKLNCSDEIIKNNNGSYFVRVVSLNNKIGGLLLNENSSVLLETTDYKCTNTSINITIKGGHLGITDFQIYEINSTNNEQYQENVGILTVNVLRHITLFDELAILTLGPLILINKCAFGAKIEIEMLKRIVTQPIELTLCLLTQFVFLPLAAVGYGYLFKLDQIIALALLVSAACPGGGGGYVFSFLVDGDITLAITASLVSTLFAMAAMPAVIGLYTLVADVPNTIVIPYFKIMLMLAMIATPISLGMLLREKRPDLAKKLVIVIRPLSLFLIAGGLVVVLGTSRYIMYGPTIGYVIAVLVPLTGFIIALILAGMFNRDWALAKAISLESGLKNTVLGVAVIELSFPQPQADLASILIIMITVGQVVVAMAWYIAHLIKVKLQNNKKQTRKFEVLELDAQETEKFLNEEE